MDYRSTTASRAARASTDVRHKTRTTTTTTTTTTNGGGLLPFDSDAESTIESLKNLMASNLRGDFKHGATREDDILFAAKRARSHMPVQFREPPSSTGSHGTVTSSSIQLPGDHDNNNGTASTLSMGPDAESTRASVYYQRGRHRVHRTTGRFGSGGSQDGGSDVGSKSDILDRVVNTSALFRTFKEWQPEDLTVSDPGHLDDDDDGFDLGHEDHLHGFTKDSTTNFGVMDALHRGKENRAPVASSPAQQQQRGGGGKTGGSLAARRKRAVLQATVQNESDMSVMMSAAAHQQTQAPRRSVSAAVPLPTARKAGTVKTAAKAPAPMRPTPSPVLDEDLTSPETSANSQEEAAYVLRPAAPQAVRSVSQPVPAPEAAPASEPAPVPVPAPAAVDSHDAVTSHSFLVPSKSFPLLHNLVTGTLRFTPGTFLYGTSGEAQRNYQLPPGPVPEDEKKIFVDVETIREEVVRLQEHDEMLQNEILVGEKKYNSLLERYYGLAHKSSDSGFGSDQEQSLKESQEQNKVLQSRVLELETALDLARTQGEEQARSVANMAAQRDTAVTRAASAADKAKRLGADVEAMREKLATSTTQRQEQQQQQHQQQQRMSAEAQRRIQQLEQMMAERERVIRALKDEREAALCSHREECRLFKERLARLAAEKNMVAGDHAKCHENRRALLAKMAQLKEQLRAVRQQCKERETAFHSVVERQRTQITKLQGLLQQKEKSVRQLDENFRRLRESWSAKDETLMRMTEVLEQWPGGLPPEHRGVYPDMTEEVTEREEEKEEEEEHNEQDSFLQDHVDRRDPQETEDDEDDEDEDEDDMSEPDLSMDENMTSAFIIPDLDFHPEEITETTEPTVPAVREAVRDDKTRRQTSKTVQKSVTFRQEHTTTQDLRTATKEEQPTRTACPHNRVNCVVCCQEAGAPADQAKVTLAVPRPSAEEAAKTGAGGFRAMEPGEALAYVMKLLEDERRHLWMEIGAKRQPGSEAQAAADEHPRQAQREPDALWRAYVRKTEQLNRLDDVLVGQRQAGQAMTRAEVDVTITRILEA